MLTQATKDGLAEARSPTEELVADFLSHLGEDACRRMASYRIPGRTQDVLDRCVEQNREGTITPEAYHVCDGLVTALSHIEMLIAAAGAADGR